MRPYLAIIKDSFRAAFASKVLYLMLLLITVFLLAIAPLTVREEMTNRITLRDIVDIPQFSIAIVNAGKSEENSAAKILWEKLPDDERKALEELYGNDDTDDDAEAADSAFRKLNQINRAAGQLIGSLNRIVQKQDLYADFHANAEVWEGLRLNAETEELVAKHAKGLDDLQRQRLNRLLCTAAFPRDIAGGLPTSLRFVYVWETGFAFPVRQQQLVDQANLYIPYIMDKFVLSLGIFVAILVTAPIIPQTFDPGALNLLLSKPIYRWCMFLAKFVGGCAFITICAVYLFFGLWLILGVRLGIWNSGFLVSIPLYVFVFAIYYTVSAITGVIFRNSIVSIVVAALFWVVCFGIGTFKAMVDVQRQGYEVNQIVDAGEQVFISDPRNLPYLWNDEKNKWELGFIPEDEMELAKAFLYLPQPMPPIVGPIYDAKNNRLIGGQMSIMNMNNPLASQRWISVADGSKNWKLIETVPAPPSIVELMLEEDGALTSLSRMGMIVRIGDPLLTKTKIETLINRANDTGGDGKDADELAEKSPEIETLVRQSMLPAGPHPPVAINRPSDSAISSETFHIAVFSQDNLSLLEKQDNGDYQLLKSKRFDLEAAGELTVKIAFAGDKILVARGNGDILLIDPDEPSIEQTWNPEATSAVRSIAGSPTGGWASVVFRNGNLWMVDTDKGTISLASLSGQGDVSATAFNSANEVWVATRINRLTRYRIDSDGRFNQVGVKSPTPSVYERAYRYVIVPLYVICPKPGEFYPLVTHLSSMPSEEESVELERRQTSDPKNPWSPFWNGLVFMIVMLAIGCLYIERQDY